MEYLLLALATLSSSGKAMVLKKLGTGSRGGRELHSLNSAIFLIAAAVVATFGLIKGDSLLPSGLTILLSLIFATLLLFTQVTEALAMKHGSASMTILVYSLGLLLPIFYGSIFLSEPVSVPQIFGMLLILAALYFIINPKSDSAFSPLWLLLSLLACFGSGATAILQKIQQSSEVRDELMSFLALAFLFASAFSLLLSLLPGHRDGEKGDSADSAAKEETPPADREKRIFANLRFALFSGACVGLLNIFNLILAGKLPSVVHFPIYNIGSMILTGIGGRVIFGEKLSPMQAVGFGIGCIAILIIGLL